MEQSNRVEMRNRVLEAIRHVLREDKRPDRSLSSVAFSRRRFLAATQALALGALVTPGCGAGGGIEFLPPTDPVAPTAAGVATQLVTGTELFQDPVYAEPVVSPLDAGSHGLIEGARGRMRLQSSLGAPSPDELAFLDREYHYGPSELVQLEEDENEDWELVHYYHPWVARTDGAKTDGLVRQVIMDKSHGLTRPTRILTATGTFTNRFESDETGQRSKMTYLVFVEDTASGRPGHFAIGTGVANVQPPFSELDVDYPVRWITRLLPELTGYTFADRYTNNAYVDPSTYEPIQATEHIVLYGSSEILILSLNDGTAQGTTGLNQTFLPYPKGAPDARVVHLVYDPTEQDQGLSYETVVLAASQKESNGDVVYRTYSMDAKDNTSGGVYTIGPNIFGKEIRWKDEWLETWRSYGAPLLGDGAFELDYSTIRSVNSLFHVSPSGTYHVKLANFEGRGIVAFTVRLVGPDTAETVSIAGHDLAQSQGVGMFVYNLFTLEAYLEVFAVWVMVAPLGFGMQIGVLADTGE